MHLTPVYLYNPNSGGLADRKHILQATRSLSFYAGMSKKTLHNIRDFAVQHVSCRLFQYHVTQNPGKMRKRKIDGLNRATSTATSTIVQAEWRNPTL